MKRQTNLVRRGREDRDESGQSTVEFALLFPLVAMAILAIIQVALVVRADVVVHQAAREGARSAAVSKSSGAAAEGAGNVASGLNVSVQRGSKGKRVVVTVRRKYRTNVPLVGKLFPDPTLKARAVMRAEI